mgnify:CR=1 FL=1
MNLRFLIVGDICMDNGSKTLSVVIIGLDEADNLQRCFESVEKAITRAEGLLSSWSIVYVDSGSSDESIGVARHYTKDIYLVTEFPSAAAGRMAGLRESNGQLVLFLDGDMELHSDWLCETLEILTNNEASAFAGITGIRDDVYIDEVSGEMIGERHNVYGVKEARVAPHFGGALLIKREAIVNAGGYRIALKAGEEPDLYARLLSQGMRVLELPIPFIRHYTLPKRSRVERLVSLCSVRAHTCFADTLWSAVDGRYLLGTLFVYRYTFMVWRSDPLTPDIMLQ